MRGLVGGSGSVTGARQATRQLVGRRRPTDGPRLASPMREVPEGLETWLCIVQDTAREQ
jgi:hypothetical protein